MESTDIIGLLIVAGLLVVVGLYIFFHPSRIANREAQYWRSMFGIEAGPAGPGTRLYYRSVGLIFVCAGAIVAWRNLAA